MTASSDFLVLACPCLLVGKPPFTVDAIHRRNTQIEELNCS